jgi:putative oxygen-independent coproporphyrinogen III oxidase
VSSASVADGGPALAGPTSKHGGPAVAGPTDKHGGAALAGPTSKHGGAALAGPSDKYGGPAPAGRPFGVYVHIPFCTRRCDYCAFATWTDRGHLTEEYVAACRREIAGAGLPAATTVFFGGGTPSLLAAGQLTSILDTLDRVPGAEVTVECNPETVTPAKLAAYRRAGVTRLSFGVQSMAPHVLAALGRQHDPAQAVRAVTWARHAGFDGSFNIDLIYGGVGETMADWRRTLDQVLALDPPHVSAYGLMVEAGTPLARQPERHPDDDDEADKYAVADATLAGAGLGWYELSNWARPGAECRHNQLYWHQGDYRGIGCAAHSHQAGHRWWNLRTPERYLAAVAAGRPPVAGEEWLDDGARALEQAQLSLRTPAGVPLAALPDDPDLDGLVSRRDGRATLTLAGRLLESEVAFRLTVPAGSRRPG